MSNNTKIQLISAGQTFVATFLVVLGTSLTTVGTLEWTTAFMGSLILAAVRAAVKAVISQFVPMALGGKK